MTGGNEPPAVTTPPSVPRVGVGVLVFRGSKVLVGRRKGSLGDGTYALPGGHLEFGETWEACAARELLEETGLSMRNVRFAWATNSIMVSEPRSSHYITLFMRGDAADPAAEPSNCEPDKCAGWEWVEWGAIPEPRFHPLEVLLQSEYRPFGDS